MATSKFITPRDGRLKRTLRNHLVAHPDSAYTTDELCRLCYGEQVAIERKHRFAVHRTLEDLLRGPTLPPHSHVEYYWGQGNMLVWFNPNSLASITEALHKRHRNGWAPSWLDLQAEAAQRFEEHRIVTQGTDGERAALAKQKQAAMDAALAQLAMARAMAC